MHALIEAVARSFAAAAPGDARLVVKNHPLDTGLDDHARFIGELERRLGLGGRIDYLETGDLAALLSHAQGVVTVNSTAGSAALAQRRPTMALGNPIYKLPGLTFHGPLDEFWREAPPPDAELFRSVPQHGDPRNAGERRFLFAGGDRVGGGEQQADTAGRTLAPGGIAVSRFVPASVLITGATGGIGSALARPTPRPASNSSCRGATGRSSPRWPSVAARAGRACARSCST